MGELHRLNLAVIGIDQHCNLGEREKRYPDGEEDVEQEDTYEGKRMKNHTRPGSYKKGDSKHTFVQPKARLSSMRFPG